MIVRNFDAHRRLAGDRRFDAHRKRRKHQRDVVRQRCDAVYLDARRGLQFKSRDRGAVRDADQARFHAKALQRADQQIRLLAIHVLVRAAVRFAIARLQQIDRRIIVEIIVRFIYNAARGLLQRCKRRIVRIIVFVMIGHDRFIAIVYAQRTHALHNRLFRRGARLLRLIRLLFSRLFGGFSARAALRRRIRCEIIDIVIHHILHIEQRIRIDGRFLRALRRLFAVVIFHRAAVGFLRLALDLVLAAVLLQRFRNDRIRVRRPRHVRFVDRFVVHLLYVAVARGFGRIFAPRCAHGRIDLHVIIIHPARAIAVFHFTALRRARLHMLLFEHAFVSALRIRLCAPAQEANEPLGIAVRGQHQHGEYDHDDQSARRAEVYIQRIRGDRADCAAARADIIGSRDEAGIILQREAVDHHFRGKQMHGGIHAQKQRGVHHHAPPFYMLSARREDAQNARPDAFQAQYDGH